jgi:hypothetical protein
MIGVEERSLHQVLRAGFQGTLLWVLFALLPYPEVSGCTADIFRLYIFS